MERKFAVPVRLFVSSQAGKTGVVMGWNTGEETVIFDDGTVEELDVKASEKRRYTFSDINTEAMRGVPA